MILDASLEVYTPDQIREAIRSLPISVNSGNAGYERVEYEGKIQIRQTVTVDMAFTRMKGYRAVDHALLVRDAVANELNNAILKELRELVPFVRGKPVRFIRDHKEILEIGP